MRYWKVTDPVGGKGSPLALFRVEDLKVERYAGLGRWVKTEYWGMILMDISGMGDGWSKYVEVLPGDLEAVKLELYPEDMDL